MSAIGSIGNVALWEVVGAVGANLQMPVPVRFGKAFLGNPPDGASTIYPPAPRLPDVSGQHVAAIQQVTRISTNTFYWAQVEASDEDEAVRLVERDVAVVISVGLTLTLGHDVATQVLSVQRLDGSEPPVSAWGAHASSIQLEASSVDRLELESLFADLRDNDQVAGCLPYLARAERYFGMQLTADELAADAAFLELAKALEYLVRKLSTRSPERSSGTDIDRILTKLTKTLTGPKGVERKRSAVIHAAGELRRLDKGSMSDAVRRFGTAHSMGKYWTAGAVRLIEVRHKHLAHPGERMSHSDRTALSHGNSGARDVVLAAVRAVLRNRGGDPIPEVRRSGSLPGGEVVVRWGPGYPDEGTIED